MKKRERIRNSNKSRKSFVTRRADTKIGALAELFKSASGSHWEKTNIAPLERELIFSGFQYLDSLKLLYNWENRFMSVNYNLEMVNVIPANTNEFNETQNCVFLLNCKQRGFSGARQYSWKYQHQNCDTTVLSSCLERLNNPLIIKRLETLDIMEMELRYNTEENTWRISCESMLGSSTWILIPPVLSMITPKREECVQFLELFELVGDAVANNR